MNYDKQYVPARPVDYLGFAGRVPRQEAIAMKVCVKCAGEAEFFADYLSEREYGITGYCQKCQDDAYATMEEME